jgi:AcrR family transcriptional regulator
VPESPRQRPPRTRQPALAPTVGEPRRHRLPRGASSLPREVVDAEQRKRLVIATAQVVAKKGYANATVADIIVAAGVSRATFYQLFADKEACFLFGFRKLAAAHLSDTERKFTADGPLVDRLVTAMAAYLARINVDHALARAFIAEAQSATPRSRRAFKAMQGRLRRALERWLAEVRSAWPGVAPRSDTDIALVMHGLTGHVIEHVRRHPSFDETQARAILRFLLAGLGLHAWAEQVDGVRAGFRIEGPPA